MDLLQICIQYFGNPRITGSHRIFKMPWQGDPRINIQKDGNMAKEYQVKAVITAIEKLKTDKTGQLKKDDEIKPVKNKTKGKKHGRK